MYVLYFRSSSSQFFLIPWFSISKALIFGKFHRGHELLIQNFHYNYIIIIKLSCLLFFFLYFCGNSVGFVCCCFGRAENRIQGIANTRQVFCHSDHCCVAFPLETLTDTCSLNMMHQLSELTRELIIKVTCRRIGKTLLSCITKSPPQRKSTSLMLHIQLACSSAAQRISTPKQQFLPI